MWTLKEKTFTRATEEELQAKGEPIGRIFDIQMSFTVTDGTRDIAVTTFVPNEDVAVSTIQNKLDAMNAQEDFMTRANDPSWTLPKKPTPPEPTAKEIAQREYDEALALFKDLSDKAELDPTTFNWGRDNQRVIVQQKLQALMQAS